MAASPSNIALIDAVEAEQGSVGNRGNIPSGVVERSYHGLANEISRFIAAEGLSQGDRLPSERVLADRFGVSRTSIREAIIALELRGNVEVRGGSGIYVRATRSPSILGDSSAGPFELLRGRLIIEPEICATAALTARDGDLDAIYASLVKMKDTVGDKRANELADRAFHVAIAAATGNRMLAQIVEGIWDLRCGEMWEKTEEHFHTPALREAAIDDHQGIFSALLSHDCDRARELMHKHLERVIREFGKAW